MASETLTFNDQLDGNLGLISSLTGKLTIDFSTNPPTVTGGKLTLTAVDGKLDLQTFSAANFKVMGNATTGYTLTAPSNQTVPKVLGDPTSNISISLTPGSTANTATVIPTLVPVPLTYSGTVMPAVVCFASGTLIRTDRGNVAVEALAIGDRVITSSGEARPIRWLGHRVYDCRNSARAQDILPVRIRAGALGEALPSRDLVVSPGHSICVDVGGEVLIPATALINGTSVVQEQVETVTYWHVELDSHDIIFAEDLASESYVEMGNRLFFVESGTVALHATPDAKVVTHDDFCRPFHLDGAVVEIVQDLLAERAAAVAETATALAA